MTGVFIRNLDMEVHREDMCDAGRDQSDASTKQGPSRTADNRQRLGRRLSQLGQL